MLRAMVYSCPAFVSKLLSKHRFLYCLSNTLLKSDHAKIHTVIHLVNSRSLGD